MAKLESIKKSKDNLPYTTPLRVKILDKKVVENKQHDVVGDATGIMKVIANDPVPAVDTAVIMRNFRKGHTCLFPTKSFTITKPHDFEIPLPIIEEGKILLNPKCQEVQLNKLKDVGQDLYKKNSIITVTGSVVGVR